MPAEPEPRLPCITSLACGERTAPASPQPFPASPPGIFWSLRNRRHIPGGKGLPDAVGTPPGPGQLLNSQHRLPLPQSYRWVETEERACHSMHGRSQEALGMTLAIPPCPSCRASRPGEMLGKTMSAPHGPALRRSAVPRAGRWRCLHPWCDPGWCPGSLRAALSQRTRVMPDVRRVCPGVTGHSRGCRGLARPPSCPTEQEGQSQVPSELRSE